MWVVIDSLLLLMGDYWWFPSEDEWKVSQMHCQQCKKLGTEMKLQINEACDPPHPFCNPCLREYALGLLQSKRCTNVRCSVPDCGKELNSKVCGFFYFCLMPDLDW